MALTPSTMLDLNTTAPDFNLINTRDNERVCLDDFKGAKGLFIAFICNHCPYVIHINAGLVKLADDYQKKGIKFVAISSNDVVNYSDDSPEKMKIHGQKENYSFPYLYDETQAVAKAYDAACTPDFYLFDDNKKLVYRGQMDSSRPGNDIPVTGEDLRQAFDSLLAGEAINSKQRPSQGCNIKWLK